MSHAPSGLVVDDRIKAAAANSGMSIPNRRLTVNLSPTSMPVREG
jgi:predicted ATPase with chaperone activity